MSEAQFSERRQEARQAASGRVRIVLPSGHAFDAELVDRSLKGMRLRLNEAASLPSRVRVISLANASVYEAQVMWRTPPYAGLSVSRAIDMRAPAAAKDAEIHKLWREHARG